jgi:hypothetical protein
MVLASGVFRSQLENNQTTYLARLWNRFLFFDERQKFMTLTHFQRSSEVLCVRQKGAVYSPRTYFSFTLV